MTLTVQRYQIRELKSTFEREKRKADIALNRSMLDTFKYRRPTRPIKAALNAIQLVKELTNSDIPKHVNSLNELLKKQKLTSDDLEKIEAMKNEMRDIRDIVHTVFQLSTPNGMLEFLQHT